MQVVGFEAPFRRAGFRKQDLEDAPGNPHDALIFADADAELDNVPVGLALALVISAATWS